MLWACSCGPSALGTDGGEALDAGALADAGQTDAGEGIDGGAPDAGPTRAPDAFADAVVSFMPGPGAGFGQDHLPDVVLGPPHGAGDSSGGLDVLSLGTGGTITLELNDWYAADGPGVDVLVFENAFTGNLEPGEVSVSADGVSWHVFMCSHDFDAGYPGCAGVRPVASSPENGISPIDPNVAGGDGFDLAQVGLSFARFVRIRDIGESRNSFAPSRGFDLDALAAVHPVLPDGGLP